MRPGAAGNKLKNTTSRWGLFLVPCFNQLQRRKQVLPILLIVMFVSSNPVFASAYLCSDGIFRSEPIPEFDCQEIEAVINREPAEIYIPASLSNTPANASFFPFSISSDYPFLNFVEKNKKMPPFQKLPEFIKQKSGLTNNKHNKKRQLDTVFEKVPHPAHLLDCINSVLQQGASPKTCSNMILQKNKNW